MQNDDWYLRHSDKVVHGPYSLSVIVESAKIGSVANDTEVHSSQHTKGTWVLASRIRPILEAMKMNESQATVPVRQAESEPPVSEPSTRGTSAVPPVEPLKQPETESPLPDFGRVGTAPERRTLPRSSSRIPMVVPSTFFGACSALFDFRFRFFITPWIIKIVWAFYVAIATLMVVMTLIGMIVSRLPSIGNEEARIRRPPSPFGPAIAPSGWMPEFVSDGLAAIIAFLFLVGFIATVLLFLRMILETIIVFFRIAEDLSQVKRVAERLDEHPR